MFDFGFSELAVIGVVMLIVVGPERLPKVARTAGHLLGRLQRYVSDVKSDIQREMQLDELKKLQQQVQEQAREVESSVRSQMDRFESGVGDAVTDLKSALPDGTAPIGQGVANTALSDAGPQLELGLDSEKRQSVPADKA